MSLARPKSQIFTSLPSQIKTFLAAKSRWTHCGGNVNQIQSYVSGNQHRPRSRLQFEENSSEDNFKRLQWAGLCVHILHSWRPGTPFPSPPGSWNPGDHRRWGCESHWSPGPPWSHLNQATNRRGRGRVKHNKKVCSLMKSQSNNQKLTF